ncbi:class I SAM-dependent methyltransferase [Rivularia sp. UHCC 0363]|uniref:class I SAM-dependent methyltransferase n=1 Tax=Rivularia sp. UHCC 0363 TaxID=3110244 RepID=UPI002B2171F8|nr:class I SAM-dependent methyltransferase [Rivularia sp. UHCC 0363]MEA5595041.1 class I SAM-dependent methyltransferase [Rivularia sp. UHCC 0363]
MKNLEQFKNIYNNYQNDCSLEQRKNWYSKVADAYNRTRPRYPQELVDRTIELAKLSENAKILEIGCGPGTATTEFAKFGFSMVCLEPSEESCNLATQNCANFPDVEIINTTFEEWVQTDEFDCVLAATSFHWVSPDIGYPKLKKVLKDNGSLILLWNKEPQPSYEVYQILDEVYQRQVPSLSRYEERGTQEKILRELGNNVIKSGFFKDLVYEQMECDRVYSIDDYLSLLSTLSPYIKLDYRQNALFDDLRNTLHQHLGNTIETSYLSAFQIAWKN